MVNITEKAMSEPEFWHGNATKLNNVGRPWGNGFIVDMHVYCDASSAGYGGYVKEVIDRSTQTDPVHSISSGCHDNHLGPLPASEHVPVNSQDNEYRLVPQGGQGLSVCSWM